MSSFSHAPTLLDAAWDGAVDQFLTVLARQSADDQVALHQAIATAACLLDALNEPLTLAAIAGVWRGVTPRDEQIIARGIALGLVKLPARVGTENPQRAVWYLLDDAQVTNREGNR